MITCYVYCGGQLSGLENRLLSAVTGKVFKLPPYQPSRLSITPTKNYRVVVNDGDYAFAQCKPRLALTTALLLIRHRQYHHSIN